MSNVVNISKTAAPADYVSIQKAAAEAGVTASFVRRQIAAGNIQAFSGKVVASDVAAAKAANEKRISDRQAMQAGTGAFRSTPSEGRAIERVRVDSIVIGPSRRPVDPAAVEHLAGSMAAIGQQSPISYRRVTDAAGAATRMLVTGGHRLAAAKHLGWAELDAVAVDVDERLARLHEIAENLHRAELTKLERDEQVAEWIRLTDAVEVLSQVATKLTEGRPEGGVRAAARDLGIDKDAAHRAVKVASISEEAKDAARAAGIDDNRSALLKVAKEATPEKQVAAVAAIARRQAFNMEKLHAETKLRALKEAGAIIVDHLDPDYREALENNLRACGLTKLVEAITSTRRRQ